MKKILLLIVMGVASIASAQQPTEMQQLQVPPVAPDFKAPQKPLPELNRVGVDLSQQRPLALREKESNTL